MKPPLEKLQNLSPQKVFLFLGIFYGLIFLFITPPMQVPDEFNHFFRAYQISEGRFISEKSDNRLGGYIPFSLVKFVNQFVEIPFHPETKTSGRKIIETSSIPLDKNTKLFFDFPNTALYPFVSYLPQSIGIFIPKIFKSSPFVLFYCGRLFAFIFSIIIIYYSIKLIPIHKWVLVLLSLLPMSLFINMSLSADVVINSLSFLFIAFLLSYAYEQKTEYITKKNILIIIILSSLLSLSKVVYIPLIFLYFLIPQSKLKNKKEYYFVFLLILFINLIFVYLWTKTINKLYIPFDEYNPTYRHSQPIIFGTSPKEQLQFILFNFPLFLKIVIIFCINQIKFITFSTIGILGWFDTYLPTVFYIYVLITLIVTSILDSDKSFSFSIKDRVIPILIFLMSVFLITLMVYLNWNPVKSKTLEGIQGRYFIPITPLFFLPFYNNKLKQSKLVNHKNCPYIILILMGLEIIFLSAVVFIIYQRYYL